MQSRLGFLGLTLLLTALLAACTAPAAPTSTPPPPKAAVTAMPTVPATASTTTAPAAKPTEAPATTAAAAAIKVGYLSILTGSLAAPGADMRDGFLMYLQEKQNSLAGRKVEVIVDDTEGKADVALTKAKKQVERDKVNMLAGVTSSAEAAALSDYIVSNKIPMLITNAGDDPLTQVKSSPYIYRVSFSNSQATHPMGAWAYKKGYRKAVVIAGDYPAGWQHIGGFARTFTEAGGEIIQEIYTPLGSPDFAPYITSINRGADVVYAFESGSDALSFVTQYAEYGLNRQIPLLGRALTDEDVLQKEGDAALGIIMSTTFLPILDRPQMKTFVAAFGQKFGRPVTQYAEAGYIGAMALEAALQSTKGNIEDVDSFLKALSVVQVEGPSSPIKFDQYHNAVRNIYFIEAKKVEGKLVNAAIETLPQVSQFWTWTPEEFMKMPPYNDMKGKWAK